MASCADNGVTSSRAQRRSANGIETYALAPQGTSSTGGGSYMRGSFLNGNVRDAENIALATAVHAHVIPELKSTDRGIKRARFNVLRGINKPAILFEGGFLSNSAEGKRIHSEPYRDELTSAIANAVVDALRPFGVRHFDGAATPERIWRAMQG